MAYTLTLSSIYYFSIHFFFCLQILRELRLMVSFYISNTYIDIHCTCILGNRSFFRRVLSFDNTGLDCVLRSLDLKVTIGHNDQLLSCLHDFRHIDRRKG